MSSARDATSSAPSAPIRGEHDGHAVLCPQQTRPRASLRASTASDHPRRSSLRTGAVRRRLRDQRRRACVQAHPDPTTTLRFFSRGAHVGRGSITTLIASPERTARRASWTSASGIRCVMRSATGTAPVAISSSASALCAGLEPFAPTMVSLPVVHQVGVAGDHRVVFRQAAEEADPAAAGRPSHAPAPGCARAAAVMITSAPAAVRRFAHRRRPRRHRLPSDRHVGVAPGRPPGPAGPR